MNHALLTYTRTRNLGDEIQSIAAWRLLPSVDDLADRDFVEEFQPKTRTKLILNGWFSHRPHTFDIGTNVEPLFISFHVNPDPHASHNGRAFADVIRESPRLRDLLSRHGPIGARDEATAEFLNGLGIPAYTSGCLTLTLEPNRNIERGDTIVLADVAPSVANHVRAITSRPIEIVRHVLGKYHTPPSAFARAERVLHLYQRAHLVITSRLHVAFPCLALGTPAMLVRSDFASPRVSTHVQLVNRFKDEEFPRIPASALEEPAENPTGYLRFRNDLIARTKSFLAESSPVAAAGAGKEASPSLAVSRVWKRSRVKNYAEYSWRWLRRSRVLRRA